VATELPGQRHSQTEFGNEEPIDALHLSGLSNSIHSSTIPVMPAFQTSSLAAVIDVKIYAFKDVVTSNSR
jgi:hypothetical protein